MRRYSTQELTFLLDGDYTNAQLYVYFSQGEGQAVIKSNLTGDVVATKDGDRTNIIVYLSQDDTASFKVGLVKVQLRYIFNDGTTDSTQLALLPVADVLEDSYLDWYEEDN